MPDTPEKSLPLVAISSRAAVRLRRGHLWIFSNEIDMKSVPEQPGAWCTFSSGGNVAGTGYFNPHSLIAGRIVSSQAHRDTDALLEARLAAAFSRRKHLLKCGSARLVFSESDLLPGLILDWYGGTAVMQSNTAGIDTVVDTLAQMIPRVFQRMFGRPLTALVIRADSSIRRLEAITDYSSIAFGDPRSVTAATIREDDVTYAADLYKGQKTGFFLDQRDNRRFLAHYVKIRGAEKVLDLFSYSGAWGLRALRAGAQEVTFVDQSENALGMVGKGAELNQMEPVRAATTAADVFDFLTGGEAQYDIVIADPPAFVKSKKNLPQAAKAYEKLNRLCWRRLKPDGLLLTCSCSHHIADHDFDGILAAAVGKEGGRGQVIFRGGQPEDHPVLLSMPETRYLKCRGIRKIQVD